jgi:hypothetical protein
MRGPSGSTGAIGQAGVLGAPGQSGAVGYTGPVGPVGFTGPRGATGNTGQTGFTGWSSYYCLLISKRNKTNNKLINCLQFQDSLVWNNARGQIINYQCFWTGKLQEWYLVMLNCVAHAKMVDLNIASFAVCAESSCMLQMMN